jgi:hypothetical protein
MQKIKPSQLPKQQEVQEFDLSGLTAKTAKVTDENAESYVENFLTLKIGERCRYCRHEYTSIEDIRARQPVYAGVHEHGHLACKSCWKDHKAG